MKKTVSISVLLFVCLIKIAAQKGIDNLIQAERNFAAYSVSNSTKEAFLKFIDSTGIVFENGKPVNGIETWNKREKRPGVLNWYPQYADISSSGDFGYTSGPWTFQNSLNDTIVARGQYTTVWHLTESNEWKFLIDLGVNNTPKNIDTFLWKGKKSIYKASLNSLLNAEEELIKASQGFIKSLSKKDQKFLNSIGDSSIAPYLNNVNGSSLLNRNGIKPQRGSFQKGIFPKNVQYKIEGSGIASSGDLGYVYGTTVINGKTENYLRIWRMEKDGWKIALEVLRY